MVASGVLRQATVAGAATIVVVSGSGVAGQLQPVCGAGQLQPVCGAAQISVMHSLRGSIITQQK